MKETIGFFVHLFALAMHLLLISCSPSFLRTVNSLSIVSLSCANALLLCYVGLSLLGL